MTHSGKFWRFCELPGAIIGEIWAKNGWIFDLNPKKIPIILTRSTFSDHPPLECVNISSSQTYLPMNNHFCGRRWFSAISLSDFRTTSPKIGYFLTHISPILAPGGSQNHQNLPECGNSLYNQTYLTIINRLGDHRDIFGTLFSDLWSSSP